LADLVEDWRCGFGLEALIIGQGRRACDCAASIGRAEWVGKFRPMDPVVFPGIAGKLGLFDAEALIAVTQFYLRLEALSQAIDSLRVECGRRESPSDLPIAKSGDAARVGVIFARLRSCFEPALRAIKSLDVPKATAFDKEVARIYPHLRKSKRTLREALEEHAQAEPV
jgi:hypothetical protein